MSTGAINSTAGTGTTPTTGTSDSSGLAKISKDQFLTLLVAQLKHQDPLSPMDGTQFAAQLAQFSSVEQLIQLNSAVADQSTAVQTSTLAGQASLGASLIGRQVVSVGDQVSVTYGVHGKVQVDVGTGGGTATLTLKDSTGHVVATRDLGGVAAGHQTMTLPDDLPSGDYTYSIDVKNGDGKAVDVTTYTTGVVDAVQFDANQITLRLGKLKVALGSVVEIDPNPASTSAQP